MKFEFRAMALVYSAMAAGVALLVELRVAVVQEVIRRLGRQRDRGQR